MRRYLHVGETYPLTLGWSEVCLHMRVADKTMPVLLTEHGARIQFPGGGYSPVTHGEAGIYTDHQGAYWIESSFHASIQRCATVGCEYAASTSIEWTDSATDTGHTERVCRECADGYLQRPALKARELATSTRESE